MAGAEIRIGTISTIDYENGMVSVKYSDKNSVTAEMPYCCINGEYKMPNIDDPVAVLYLSTGTSVGIVLGSFWNTSNKPPISGKDVFCKLISSNSSIQFENNELVIKAPKIKLITDNGENEF